MKFSLAIAFAVIASSSAGAVQAADYCTEVALDAEQIMVARQNGESLQRVNFLFSQKYRGDMLAVSRMIIADAYLTPVYESRDDKVMMVKALSQRWHNKCRQAEAGY